MLQTYSNTRCQDSVKNKVTMEDEESQILSFNLHKGRDSMSARCHSTYWQELRCLETVNG